MKWLLPLLLVLAACAVNAPLPDPVDYSSYCGSGDVYRCGDYIRVFGQENLVFLGDEELCGSDPNNGLCGAALHETCELKFSCGECTPEQDSFMLSNGDIRCVPHFGLEYLEKRSQCLRSTEVCECVKAEYATNGTALDLGYRCIADQRYEEFLLHTSGLCKKDLLGVESCFIA